MARYELALMEPAGRQDILRSLAGLSSTPTGFLLDGLVGDIRAEAGLRIAESALRRRQWRKAAEALADIADGFPDLTRGRAAGPRRWYGYEAADWLVQRREWLRSHCAGPALLHGDFKASNLHFTEASELLVLDWEFAYAGPPWMDVGQLFRWDAPAPFRAGFERAFFPAGRKDWEVVAQAFDVVNLVGLVVKAEWGSQQFADCRERLRHRLGDSGSHPRGR